MSKLLRKLALFASLVVGALVIAGGASAHLHPFLPAPECAPEETGAGNESEGLRTAPWVPDSGPFIIQASNPGKADEQKNFFAPNPGVDNATASCANAQP